MKNSNDVQAELFGNTKVNSTTQQGISKENDSNHRYLLPIKVTPAYDTYWRFEKKRQDLFINKIRGNRHPWVDDPILQKYKFTNIYRVNDRVSQYLIKNVIYSKKYESQDVFFRIILFKLFNRIETWELL